MSADDQKNMPEAHVRLQTGSGLLSAPWEIRRAIYSILLPDQVHVFLSQGKLRLSICLQPNLGDDVHDGRERSPRGTSDTSASSLSWASRLWSSWGPHWQCEEICHKHCHPIIHGFIFLCKQVFLDVSDMITEIAAINVTDLDTLSVLLSRRGQLRDALNCGWDFWEYASPDNIRRLNLTFRLPVAFYRMLEYKHMNPEQAQRMSAKSTMNTLWASIWPAIFQLGHLRSLHIWLDHDEKRSWSILKECTALRDLSAALTAHKLMGAQESDAPHVNVVVNLPKLHPGVARPDSHFTELDSPSSFTIQRRIRQRWHCIEEENGELHAKYSPNFPIMEMSREFVQFILEYERVTQTPLEQVEEYERGLWETGVDVEAMWEREITELSEPAASLRALEHTSPME
ncbi:hypothetical protein GGR55DRAFT_636041 [Xylaria sp. FL0064]|nr:hypothetical protein GGR55DRAFT_636041 [Xylaria sp. FL0064]